MSAGRFYGEKACARSHVLSQCPLRVGGARACRLRAVSYAGANSQTLFCAFDVRKCAVFGGAAEYMAVRFYRRQNWTLR